MIKRFAILSLVLTLSFGATACSKESSSGKTDKPSASKEEKAGKDDHGDHAGHADHATADVKPGSHEDWCGEHAVPESKCTKCDPSLVAAFKATGDWCAEHGLPESQCLKCNPDLKIVRPPKAQ